MANDGSERPAVHIKQKFTLVHKKFTIDSIYGEYAIEAVDILAHSFKLSKEERIIAYFSKKYLSATSTYDLTIADDENQPFVCALLIVIHQVLYTFHWQKLTVLR